MKSGDCLSCGRLPGCNTTSVDLVQRGHTCEQFEGVTEPVYLARLETMRRFGDRSAIAAMMIRPKKEEAEEQPPKEEGTDDE